MVDDKNRNNDKLLEEILSEIKCHEDTIRDIRNNTLIPIEVALKKAQQYYAETKCFCKVGDKIRDGDSDPVIVSKILPSFKGFELRVFKLKKNGDRYKSDSSLWNWQDDWSNYVVLDR